MDTNPNRSDQIYDELLILRCQGGDPASMQELVLRWQSRLVQFAGVVTRDPDLARDAVQDAWVAIIRKVDKLKDPAHYRAWMFRIVHNKCIDHLRSHRASGDESHSPSEPSTRSALDDVEHKEQVALALASMNEHHRAVLALHYLQGFEVAEIADMLEVPSGTVKSRLFNAREAFRKSLEETGGTHEGSGPKNRTSIAIHR